MSNQHLVQILLPKSNGDGAPVAMEWFVAFVEELSDRFGGATSFLRAPAEGLWEDGGKTEQDDIVIVEVMTPGLDESYWTALKKRLQLELAQDEIVIRASHIRML